MIAALFDVEGTLYETGIGRGLMNYISLKGKRRALWRYMASVTPRYYMWRIGLSSRESMQTVAVSEMARLLKGWSVEQGEQAFEWIAETQLTPGARKTVQRRLKDHLDSGHVVILVSGGFEMGLKPIARQLQVPAAIGSRLEVSNGRLTGLIDPPIVTGQEKVNLVQAYAKERDLEINWADSYAYADAISDLSMLEFVGHPRAVYPDKKLRAIALDRKWQIITDS